MQVDIVTRCWSGPPWNAAAWLSTIVFVIAAALLSRRIGSSLLPLLVPIGGNLLATWLDLWWLATDMSASGSGHHAASAAAGDAQLFVMLGFGAAAAVGAVFAARSSTQRRELPAWLSAAGMLIVILLAGELLFTWYVTREGRSYSRVLGAVALLGAILSCALLLGSLIGTMRLFLRRSLSSEESRGAIVTAAVVSAGVVMSAWFVARWLWSTASGGG